MNIKTVSFLLGFVLVVLFYPKIDRVAAQESCGNFIEVDEGEQYVEPIEDCDELFGPLNPNNDLIVTFDGTEIEEGGSYQFFNQSGTVELQNVAGNSIFSTIYHHVDDDYYISYPFGNYTFTATGTYTIVVVEEDLILSYLDQIRSFFIPVAHAAVGDTTTITFTVTAEEVSEPEPEIDPLLLEYVPILYMHEDEDYFPMNVESFVNDSGLWSQVGLFDTVIRNEEDLTFEEFESIVGSENTEDYYLAYSDPDNDKKIELAEARAKYGRATNSGEATTTVYVHKMTDNYTDEQGDEHHFIVLQYWYFYAMNNWAEQGGFNNHEGDWESVFIFLDETTEEPKYAAFSSHHNDGFAELGNLVQYDSVRRDWSSEQLVLSDRSVASFVSLGSHANYPNNGDDGDHTVPYPLPFEDQIDETSENGEKLMIEEDYEVSVIQTSGLWFSYEGKWGTDGDDVQGGDNGPTGPNYIKLLSNNEIRFHKPVEWAGIDQITEYSVDEPTDTITSAVAQVNMKFTEALGSGTVVTIDPHEEPVTFGINVNKITFLPSYYDFTTSLDNFTFTVSVTLTYTDEELTVLGLDEKDLTIFYFNSVTETWEEVAAVVDPVANTISFVTDHFSKYAIGVASDEGQSIEELLTALRAEIDATGLVQHKKNLLHKRLNRVERLLEKDKPQAKKNIRLTLNKMEKMINRYSKRGLLTEEEADLLDLIEDIRQKV